MFDIEKKWDEIINKIKNYFASNSQELSKKRFRKSRK
jgi:hypothetical protein